MTRLASCLALALSSMSCGGSPIAPPLGHAAATHVTAEWVLDRIAQRYRAGTVYEATFLEYRDGSMRLYRSGTIWFDPAGAIRVDDIIDDYYGSDGPYPRLRYRLVWGGGEAVEIDLEAKTVRSWKPVPGSWPYMVSFGLLAGIVRERVTIERRQADLILRAIVPSADSSTTLVLTWDERNQSLERLSVGDELVVDFRSMKVPDQVGHSVFDIDAVLDHAKRLSLSPLTAPSSASKPWLP
ncbi:MAG: hypothetical protein H0T46_08245 [Deltaproteobacteria bacterium]|nr:hypothetical protein [Deltaproteobacteria bacterium]